MENTLRNLGEKALNEARKKGVEAEVYLLHDKELSVEIVDSQVDTLKEADETGMGIRVIKDGRVGFAFTSDLSDQALKNAVEDAINISIFTSQDEFHRLPEKASYQDMDLYDTETANMSLEEKIEIARTVERAARATDQRITIIEKSGYDELEYYNLIMNSRGLYAYHYGNFSDIYILLVAEENQDAQNGFSMMSVRKIKNMQPVQVGEEAANKAIRALNARSIKSGRVPVILDSYVAASFSGLVSAMVNAELVQKGKSMFVNQIDSQVASPLCSIIDDACLEDGIASSPFDDEGVASNKTYIIKNGVLESFLHNTYTANKAGINSTGNARRGSFRGMPSVGSSNFIIAPGQDDPVKLLDGIEQGLYVTEVMGMHTANPISGDFSVGAAGLMIENGVLTYPVRGVTIAGNMVDLLHNIDGIGNKLRFYGSKASPAIRIKELSVAGE